jgi:photosystem II stability/assembly factor-like uncharacterized protein
VSGDGIRFATFLIALAVLITATFWMHFQPRVPDPLRPVEAFSLRWWLHPIERNGFMLFPFDIGFRTAKLFVLPASTHAWASVENSAQLLHTADRGETWEVITVAATRTSGAVAPSDASITDFHFSDPSHGWVLANDALFNSQILETRDGGKSWTTQMLQGSAYVALDVSGSRLVAGGLQEISSSIDGGKRWRSVPVMKDTLVTALHIAPDGRIWAGTSQGSVWWSTDALEWVLAGDSGLTEIDRIFFDETKHGFVETMGAIAKSSDGGRTWSPFVLVPKSLAVRLGFRRMDADEVTGLRGAITLDDSQFTPPIQALEAFNDQKHAIAVCEDGQILVTRDGSSWWRTTLPAGFVRAIYADASGKRLWSAGRQGILLTSSDGGENWTPLKTARPEDLLAISFAANGTRGWAVGYGGRIVMTSNGGRSWEQVNAAQSAHVAHSDDVSLVGYDAVVSSDDGMHVKLASVWDASELESSDGGNTWRSQRNAQGDNPSVFLSGIDDQWFTGPGESVIRLGPGFRRESNQIPTVPMHIVATGESGWVREESFPTYRTTDGGRTWRPTLAPQDVNISDVRFLDANHGFAETISDGKKFETRDGGKSWQPILSDPSFWSVKPLIANADGKRLWTTTLSGVPLRSVDGGKSWMAPEYHRYPAPWYYLTFAPVAILLFVSMRKPAPVVRAESSIEDVPWNDKPVTDPDADRLDYRPLAAGIARFFGNQGTEPPLTIAITGPWGSGKSSLMNLVADAVKRYDYRPVWFNAWHYQSEEFLLPAVLESLRTEAVPRFWTLHGLQFRMRLLVLRGMKNWLPALVIMAVLVTTAAYFMRDHDAFRQLVENVRNLGTAKGDKFFESAGLVISSLLSMVIVFRSLNAFGVSGTRIAAILSGSVRLADAGGQTGFRHRFARAFGEVTRALGRNRLVLFIDDLDRCRPDHVLSVLECINFLVTSGDCFIIAGMDRPRVEQFVAMRFKDESNAIGADSENAQLYLEKLINIEVPVPLAPSSRSRELFAGDRREAAEKRVHATAFGERLIAFGQAGIPWIVGLAVLAGAAYLGYAVLPDRYHPQQPPQSTVVTAIAAAPATPVPNAPLGMPKQLSPEKQTNVRPTRFVQPIVPNRREVLPIIGILLIVVCGIVRLSIERAKLEQDSKDFRTALRQWHPLLYAANATPRSMKRCVNRVRYYAMRQRTNPLPPTLPERLTRLLHRLRGIAPLQDDASLAIPENILVPVSVVQHIFPHWLDDDEFWRDPATYVQSRQPMDELADGIASLRVCGSIEDYRGTFARISAGIHVAGATDGRPAIAQA